MYEAFFGMEHTPFVRDVPPEKLYESNAFRETLGRLSYVADRQMFAVVTADPGCGKSTLIRRFYSELPKEDYIVLYLSDSKLTPRWFYKGLLDQLGLESRFYRGDSKRQLQQEIEIIRGVQHKKVVCILDEAHLLEKKTLEELKQRGITNGVPDMEIWDKEKLLKEEPNLSDKAVAALSSPNVGIVSPWELALALAETAVLNGVEVKLNTEVSGIEKENDTYKIETNNGVIEAKYICNAAGVFADKVNEMCNEKTFEITPNKGEYYLMDKSQGNLVNHVIFQCPNEKGKGVLVAPTVHGNLIVGPDSQPSAADDVSTTKQGLDFVRNTALKSVPGINFRESIRNFAGVRARTADHDFHIYEDKNNKGFINIAGMQSPGLSSACAIAPDILKMLENSGLTLEAKEDIVDERHIDRFKHLSHEDRAKLVEKNPAFGKIICRCETITEGEIINAVHRPIPATSIDAVKRRCNAGTFFY